MSILNRNGEGSYYNIHTVSNMRDHAVLFAGAAVRQSTHHTKGCRVRPAVMRLNLRHEAWTFSCGFSRALDSSPWFTSYVLWVGFAETHGHFDPTRCSSSRLSLTPLDSTCAAPHSQPLTFSFLPRPWWETPRPQSLSPGCEPAAPEQPESTVA